MNDDARKLPSERPRESYADWNTQEYFQTATAEDVARHTAAGADPNARDEDGQTPLHWAAANRNSPDPGVIRALLAGGAFLDACDEDEDTPLLKAAHAGSSEVIAELVAAGANTEARAKGGPTALYMAAYRGSIEAVAALVAAGANPEARREAENFYSVNEHEPEPTPLHAAASHGTRSLMLITMLLKAGASPKVRGELEETPLHRAADHGSPEACTALLAAGADPDARDWNGQTPLHRAAYRGPPETVDVLLDAGADPQARDKDDKQPWDYARENYAIQGTDACQALDEERFI